MKNKINFTKKYYKVHKQWAEKEGQAETAFFIC